MMVRTKIVPDIVAYAAERENISPRHIQRWWLYCPGFDPYVYTVVFLLRPAPDWDVKRVRVSESEMRSV